MSDSGRANTSPDESVYGNPPRRGGEAGSLEGLKGQSPSEFGYYCRPW